MMQTDAQPEEAKTPDGEHPAAVAKALQHLKQIPRADALRAMIAFVESDLKSALPQTMGDAASGVAADVKHDCTGGNCCGSC